MDLHRANSLGAIVSLIALGLCILIFLFRLGGMPVIYFIQLTAILLFILICRSRWIDRSCITCKQEVGRKCHCALFNNDISRFLAAG
jgi:hypothetical protein